MRDVTVRSIEARDRAAWRPLWDAYNAFYGRSGATALPAEITENTWTRFFDVNEPVYALVADEGGGRLIGLVHYLFHPSTTAMTPVCYLQDLFIEESARGRGVGGALIRMVYERACAAGSRRVYWQTHETNKRAMRLYDQVATKSGFLVYRKDL